MLLEWAPDGALLLVATTAPRLRVDNGLLILSLHGDHLHRQDLQVCDAAIPALAGLPCRSGRPVCWHGAVRLQASRACNSCTHVTVAACLA